MTSLLHLPPEILEVIFDYAAYAPTKPVRHSSPGTFCIPKRLPSATSLLLLCLYLTGIAQAIVWRHITVNHTRPASMTTLLLLLGSLSRTKPIKLGHDREDQTLFLATPSSCVQSLYLSHFHRLKDTMNLATLLRRCEALKTLHLVDSGFVMSPALRQVFEQRGPTLQRFYLFIDEHFERRTVRHPPHGLDVALQLMPRVQSLVVQLTSPLNLSMAEVPCTSLKHLHISALSMTDAFITQCFSDNEQLEEITFDGMAARHRRLDPDQPTPMDHPHPETVKALHFLDVPPDQSIFDRSFSTFQNLSSLTLEGPVHVEWLAKAAMYVNGRPRTGVVPAVFADSVAVDPGRPGSVRHLSLVNLQVSPLPVLEHIITNPDAIAGIDFLRCTFETGSAFYLSDCDAWELPLPRNFFLPAFEELESSATLQDGFSGGMLTISHKALQKYARTRGRERPQKVLLVEEFGFEPVIP